MTSHQEPTDTRLLELAADHIRRAGPKRTTVVGIAEAAGMSHANVYRYFPSKEALLDAVTAHWLKPLEADLRYIADGPDPADDKLERVVSAIYRAYRNKLEEDRRLFELFSEAVESGRGVARKHRGKLQVEIQRIIEEGMAAGAFAQIDQRRAMALTFDALNRFTHPAAMGADRETPRAALDQRFDRVASLVLRALQSGRY